MKMEICNSIMIDWKYKQKVCKQIQSQQLSLVFQRKYQYEFSKKWLKQRNIGLTKMKVPNVRKTQRNWLWKEFNDRNVDEVGGKF